MNSPRIEMFQQFKKDQKPIKMVTCYDFSMAKIIAESSVDAVLVGDSVAMVQHGFDSTIHATPEMMQLHTAAVARGLGNKKFLVADMPFMSFRQGTSKALKCAGMLVRAGAHAVKVEGVKGHDDVVEHLVDSGVPVMGHIGLTPQLALSLGGHKVQGRNVDAVLRLKSEALQLQKLGAFCLVLECVPASLAEEVTNSLDIPTIGIGAGSAVSGQILVLNDMLGLSGSFKPKFLRHFESLGNRSLAALNEYASQVDSRKFPNASEEYQ